MTSGLAAQPEPLAGAVRVIVEQTQPRDEREMHALGLMGEMVAAIDALRGILNDPAAGHTH